MSNGLIITRANRLPRWWRNLPPLWTPADQLEYDERMRRQFRRRISSPRRSHAQQFRLLGAILATGVIAASVASMVRSPVAALNASTRTKTLICAETDQVFRDRRCPPGATFPALNRRTQRRTLYPAERCYWNADGSVRPTPTLVLLNQYRDVPGPTLCPDCGREVTPRNPMPPLDLLAAAK